MGFSKAKESIAGIVSIEASNVCTHAHSLVSVGIAMKDLDFSCRCQHLVLYETRS